MKIETGKSVLTFAKRYLTAVEGGKVKAGDSVVSTPTISGRGGFDDWCASRATPMESMLTAWRQLVATANVALSDADSWKGGNTPANLKADLRTAVNSPIMSDKLRQLRKAHKDAKKAGTQLGEREVAILQQLQEGYDKAFSEKRLKTLKETNLERIQGSLDKDGAPKEAFKKLDEIREFYKDVQETASRFGTGKRGRQSVSLVDELGLTQWLASDDDDEEFDV